MLKFTPEMMKNFADARIKDMEHGWILKELKNAYGSVLLALDDPFLAGEIKACLLRCDELGLTSTQDRLGFCFIDIVGFPGFRNLPKLPDMIAKCRETSPNSEAIMLEFQRIAPSAFWVGVLERTLPERERRGMPT
ncbi:MAG: hypothetical protein NTX45_11265 [Proteobacteria bacterium]|nr:hypothetical protein [Pseudomonadota bacterium]